jgi:hypothetical protein
MVELSINLGTGPSKMHVVSRLDHRISEVGDHYYADPLLKQQAFEKKNDRKNGRSYNFYITHSPITLDNSIPRCGIIDVELSILYGN